jgi:guanylate kinase
VARAREELTFAGDYDYEIINDTLEKAVEDFKAVVRAEECKTIKAEN